MNMSAIFRIEEYHGKQLLSPDNLDVLRTKLNEFGYVKIPGFLQGQEYELLKSDIHCLEKRISRRDFMMPGYRTPRHLHVAGGRLIRAMCPSIIAAYSNVGILSFITQIVGRTLYQIDHPEEFVVVNFLTKKNDTHGWHLDDPRYAFIVAITVPEEGGCIEIIPHWKQFLQSLKKDIPDLNDQVEHARKSTLVIKEQLEIGDAYLLDAAESLHRVTPVTKGTRVAINFAYHDQPALKYGETADFLYAERT